MTSDYVNPKGAVGIGDGGTPRTWTIMAREVISGGQWVNGSSAEGVVSSGATTYATSDIEGFVVSNQIGSQVIGLAINTIESGAYGVIARRGDFILPALSGTAIGSITSGMRVVATSGGGVGGLISGLAWPNASAGVVELGVGRAMSSASSAATHQYCIVSLNL